MLVSFELNNFLSYKDKAYLSMEKMSNKRKPSNYYNIKIDDEKLKLLKSCFLFGGNASGKTNLLSALMNFKRMVIEGSSDSYKSNLPYTPFEFSDKYRTAPISFDIEFIEHNILYKYDISFNRNKILYEKLFCYENGEYNLILNRTIDDGFTEYPTDFPTEIFDEIKDNELSINFLQNKNWFHAVNVHKWFSKLTPLTNLDESELFELLYDEKRKDFIIKILRAADFNIQDIRISKNKEYMKEEFIEHLKDQFPLISKEVLNQMQEKEIVTYHVDMIHDMSSNYGISLAMESSGTKIFFYLILQILFDSEQKVFLMDEFEDSLSQDLVELIVDIINLSQNNSQYIFTTHDTLILKNNNLLNEQLYLIDKQQDGTSDIYSVEDFDEKLTKAQIYKHYINGELGDVPNVDKQNILDIIKDEINK